MKNILFAFVVFLAAGVSSSSFAKEAPKHKVVVINFSVNDTQKKLPLSYEEEEVAQAQARHGGQMKSLDAALANLD